MKRNIIITMLCFFFSCSNTTDNGKWKKINIGRIESENIAFHFLSDVNSKSAILLGSEYTDQDLINKRFENFDAVIYHTNNRGNSWERKKIGKGKFTAIGKNDSLLLVALSSDKSTDESTLIFASDNHAKTWKMISSLEHMYVRNLWADATNNIYIIGKQTEQSSWILLKRSVSDSQWTEICNIGIDLFASPVIINNTIFFISVRRNASSTIKAISLKSGQQNQLHFADREFEPYFVSANNKELYVTGTSKSAIRIYKYDGKLASDMQLTEEIDKNNKFPVALHFAGNHPVLLTGEKNSIGVLYYLYYKNEGQANWNIEPVPSSVFSPFTFFTDSIWGYAGGYIYSFELR